MKKITESEIVKLENSILSADPHGDEIVIKDLRNQIFSITKKLRSNYGYMPREIDLYPQRFKKNETNK